jgi:hypothetical protein
MVQDHVQHLDQVCLLDLRMHYLRWSWRCGFDHRGEALQLEFVLDGELLVNSLCLFESLKLSYGHHKGLHNDGAAGPIGSFDGGSRNGLGVVR